MKLDWTRMLGFEQVNDRQAMVSRNARESRIGGKVGGKDKVTA